VVLAAAGISRARVSRLAVPLLILALLIAGAGCGQEGDHASSPTAGSVPIRTLAFVVTDCREKDGVVSWSQELRVQSGNSDPITVLRVGPSQVAHVGLCAGYAEGRFGYDSLLAGAFQRLGVSPDGLAVVFEMTTAFSVIPSGLTVDEGIFFVRRDGTGLRRLAPASHEAAFRSSGLEIKSLETLLAFSPDGATVTYTDVGPGPADEDAVQVFTIDVATGVRTQVTRLPRGPIRDANRPSTFSPFFLDDRRIAFFTTANPDGLNPESYFRGFTIDRDGTDLKAAPVPVAAPGSQVIPIFAITGPEPTAVLLPGTDGLMFQDGFAILDVFLVNGGNLLQLTNFQRNDITDALVSADGQRVLFNASVNPTGENPSGNCQLFSVDPLGGDLRQLTHFSEAAHSFAGCYFVPRPFGCEISFLFQDPVTQTLLFNSNCNPLNANPNGSQIFAMRPDGSGLRQVTDLGGLVTEADGTVAAELPGPFAYSARASRALR